MRSVVWCKLSLIITSRYCHLKYLSMFVARGVYRASSQHDSLFSLSFDCLHVCVVLFPSFPSVPSCCLCLVFTDLSVTSNGFRGDTFRKNAFDEMGLMFSFERFCRLLMGFRFAWEIVAFARAPNIWRRGVLRRLCVQLAPAINVAFCAVFSRRRLER